MIFKHRACVCIVTLSLFPAFLTGYIEAAERRSEEAGLSNISPDEYKKKMSYEKTILEGLRKLLELKQRKTLVDGDVTTEVTARNEKVTIKKRTGKYGAVLYSVKADFVSIDEILQTLISVSRKDIIIDEDIDKEELSSIISLHLENTPFVDILGIILGKKGFETIIMNEDLIFVTLPTKLHVTSLAGYYQEKAIQAYQKAMIKYPDYEGIAKAYYEMGNFYLTSEYPSIALQKYKAVRANYPDHPLTKESMLKEGKCYEMLGDTENARMSYLDYVQRYPQASDVDTIYLIIGDLWRKQGNYENAVNIYQHIIKEYYDRDTVMLAYMRLGDTYIDLKDYASALQTFLSMKRKFRMGRQESNLPEQTHADTIAADQSGLSEGQGRSGNDKSMSRLLTLPDELRYELGYQIGNCYYLLGEYDKAIHELGEFVFYEKDNDILDNAYYKLADCFFKKGDFLTAFQVYKSALSEFSKSSLAPHGFLYSGKSLHQMKILDNAIEILNQGLSNHPDGIYAERMKFEIGLCHLDKEDYKRALNRFEEIVKDKKDEDLTIQAYIYAGICLERENQPEKAIENYREALNGDMAEEQRNWVFRLIGDSYSKLGLPAKAIKAYQLTM